MITPEQVRQKAANLYRELLGAELRGEAAAFFPRVLPCNKRAVGNLATAAESVRELRRQSKEACGFGYAVEWTEVSSRTYGKNGFPARVVFETESDLVRLIGKEKEFQAFRKAAALIRARYPELTDWICGHRQAFVDSLDDVEGLVEVIDCLRARPRPGLFVRELPLGVDTKFIERHATVLRDWLDRTLPPESIDAGEQHFQRRFGLAYPERELLIRFLDPEVQAASNSPWRTLALPMSEWSRSVPVARRAFVIENKTNLLTLPMRGGAIAIGGLGNAVSELAQLSWLGTRDIWYWGDIDVEGFTILARLRALFPQVRSIFMDLETLERWRDVLAVSGSGASVPLVFGLTAQEQAAFELCATENLRIEQERLPQAFVLSGLPE